jgi:hypothetical protein
MADAPLPMLLSDGTNINRALVIEGWFVATSLEPPSRDRVRVTRRTGGLLMQYIEGPKGESAGRRVVVAADRRLQQKRS